MSGDKKQIQFNKAPEEILRDRRQRELDGRQQAAQEQMSRLKAPSQPLGGIPPVHIPPLDAEPIEGGGPMARQASTLRDPTNPISPFYSPELAMMASKQKEEGAGPFSILPPDAQKQPGFVPGIGSMYTANQPKLQKREEAPYKPVLSEKTRESMEALAAFQSQVQQQQKTPVKEPVMEVDEKQQATANLGKAVEQEGSKFQEELQDLLRDDPAQWNILNNPNRRKKIEERLGPMNITDIIIYGEIRQDVPIVPDKLIVTYRSVAGEEDLAIKQMMFGESGGDRYLMDKYTIMQLTLALVSINGDELPAHLDNKKKFEEEKFLKKFDAVVKFPIQLIADLGLQYLWFDERVRKLFLGSTEELKNT